MGTLDVLGTVLDLSAKPTVLTKVHSRVLLGGTLGGHPHVSVSVPDEFSDLVVGPEVTKRFGVTAEDFSLRTSSPISGMVEFMRNVTGRPGDGATGRLGGRGGRVVTGG